MTMASHSPSLSLLGFSIKPKSDPHNSSPSQFELTKVMLFGAPMIWTLAPIISQHTISVHTRVPLDDRATVSHLPLSNNHHPPLLRQKSTLNSSISITFVTKMILSAVRFENSNIGGSLNRLQLMCLFGRIRRRGNSVV